MPLGVKRGPLDEPGPRFVDVEGEADKEACIWERSGCESGKTGNGSKLGRRFYGTEIKEEYFRTALKNLASASMIEESRNLLFA